MLVAATNEMTEYYRRHDLVDYCTNKLRDEETNKCLLEKKAQIFSELDEIYKENPDISPAMLKGINHRVMAKHCDVVIFPHNPFFFEIGYNYSRSWGIGGVSPISWSKGKLTDEVIKNHPLHLKITSEYLKYFDNPSPWNLCSMKPCFDGDHHTLGYTRLFSVGYGGILKEAQENAKKFPEGSPERDYCMAVTESINALITIAHKFSHKASEMLEDCRDERVRRNLLMIKECAKRIPENPPETFYEGLCMLLFTREVVAVMEGIGVSQLGHADRLLGKLYSKDIEEGRITEEEARELVALWMMHTDIKFDLHNNLWPETSTCVQLGGCDENGDVVFNDVTGIFIEEHQKHKFVNPKLNCRYRDDSPEEYLRLIGRAVLSGHNTFALINDNVVIEGLKKAGAQERDARLYVNGGCQETMIEGKGHTEGAALYVSMLRLFDLFLRPDEKAQFDSMNGTPATYEEFYSAFSTYVKRFLYLMTEQRDYRQVFYKKVIKAPLYSCTQEGCLENGRDYVDGGAKYNFATVALVGLANVVDSLYAVKTLVYDRKEVTLAELLEALEKNWEGYEELQAHAKALPKYGHNNKEVDVMANEFLGEISSALFERRNERGGRYLTSTFVYSFNRIFASTIRATPDGRRNNEYMANGCGPSTISSIKDPTEPVKSMQNMDFTSCGGGISVLDLMLPSTKNFNEEVFTAFMRACLQYNCPTLQPNVLSKEELLDAMEHPEAHRDLIVRVCGLSAYFVALFREVQEEIIIRNFYEY